MLRKITHSVKCELQISLRAREALERGRPIYCSAVTRALLLRKFPKLDGRVRWGLADIARHVTGCHLSQETRVQTVCR